ncbi:MAG: HAD family hydrolase [candidate division WOR-3 bacterium]
MKAIFLDRDGTIIKNVPYLNDPEKIEFLPYVIESLKILISNGFTLFIVTNQSGISRGLIKLKELEKIHKRIKEILKKEGIKIKDIVYCPHLPEENCNCRKPKTGLIEVLLKKYKIDLKKSYLIGDKDEDILLAKNIGIKSVSVSDKINVKPDFIAKNFKEAVLWIIKDLSS